MNENKTAVYGFAQEELFFQGTRLTLFTTSRMVQARKACFVIILARTFVDA